MRLRLPHASIIEAVAALAAKFGDLGTQRCDLLPCVIIDGACGHLNSRGGGQETRLNPVQSQEVTRRPVAIFSACLIKKPIDTPVTNFSRTAVHALSASCFKPPLSSLVILAMCARNGSSFGCAQVTCP